MTIPVDISWPPAVPLPLLEYSGSPRNSTISGSEENAKIHRRSRSSKDYDRMAVSWVLTVGQHDAFQDFFETELGNGTAAFAIDLRYPVNSNPTESSLVNWMVRFSEGYRSSWIDGLWAVEAELDLIAQTELPDLADLDDLFHTGTGTATGPTGSTATPT